MTRRGCGVALTGVLAASVLALLATPAGAATTGHIAGQSYHGGTLSLIFQANALAKGATIDPTSVQVTVGGSRLPVRDVSPLSATSAPLDRTAMLAIDNSRSMRLKLGAAKTAADVFLAEVPPDVKVGLVTFGKTATLDVAPTTTHASVGTRVHALQVDSVAGTALYDAVTRALSSAGNLGARSILLLTDGDDVGSTTSLSQAVTAVTNSGIALDAVYIGPSPTVPPDLQDLVDGARGQVLEPQPAQLAKVFAVAARAISSQVQITVEVPPRFAGRTADIAITATAGAAVISDTASFDFPKAGVKPGKFGPQAVPTSTPLMSDSLLPLAIGALFVGLVTILGVAFTVADVGDRKQGRIRRRLSIYTVTGRPTAAHAETSTALGNSQIARSAVELAGRVVQKRDFEGELSRRLESAGVPLRAAEWMLIHIGVALSLSFLLLLVSGGAILPTVVGLVLGLIAPWLYLSFKESRRTSSFLAQLPDTLQLVAGSLSAGYAIAQAIDTVVREGQQPITGEFNRALIEARLGVPIEDALEGVATRMRSKDFAWVVMAIRIQREVGGNLAELLTTVAGTLRERERLRRQVKVLSAEGRLSAWILGLLPPAFSLYLILVRPQYLRPLVTDPLGWLMLSIGALLLVVGAGWMTKAVRVEV
jgi:tight adherence protein B